MKKLYCDSMLVFKGSVVRDSQEEARYKAIDDIQLGINAVTCHLDDACRSKNYYTRFGIVGKCCIVPSGELAWFNNSFDHMDIKLYMTCRFYALLKDDLDKDREDFIIQHRFNYIIGRWRLCNPFECMTIIPSECTIDMNKHYEEI